MTLIEHYLATRIQIMAGMLDIAAGRLHAAGDDWAAGECEREAQHGREALDGPDVGQTAPHPGRETHRPVVCSRWGPQPLIETEAVEPGGMNHG